MGTVQEILDLQRPLNDQILAKLHMGGRSDFISHIPSKLSSVFNPGKVDHIGVHSDRAFWCRVYAQALQNEVVEFIESAGFKFWSKDEECDVQNLKVEVIDMLHFWISLCLLLGMTEEDIMSIYKQKIAINKKRSDSGNYSRETKTEDDNKAIKT
jgi:dimeric dUTPase (all-alpha-NTP-PPase superfamily)